MARRQQRESRDGTDARQRAEDLVSEHFSGRITALVEVYLRASAEHGEALRSAAVAERSMRDAVVAMRAMPGLSEELVASLCRLMRPPFDDW
jgi:hypothetical protein